MWQQGSRYIFLALEVRADGNVTLFQTSLDDWPVWWKAECGWLCP